jgi:hypothetical protein
MIQISQHISLRKNCAEVKYGCVKIILKHLKYSYENNILGEINITRKLVPILLLNYFELRCLKCNYSGIKHVSNYQ